MKKFILLIFSFLLCFSLCSCPFGETITHPNMVEYEEDVVLAKAKEKYSFSTICFKDRGIKGEKEYDEDGNLLIDKISPVKIYNGDNIENAFKAFAGKNGGHYVQGLYSLFICYYGLGKKDDGSYLFFFYNLNIDKDAKIEDTIGASKYMYDVLPDDLKNKKISAPSGLREISYDIYKKEFIPEYFSYDKDRLSMTSGVGYYLGERNVLSYRLEFFKENDEIAYDLFLVNDEEEKLIYSTSDKYSYIEYKYGMDFSEYFDIDFIIEETEDKVNYSCKSKLKDVDGNILYSIFNYVLRIEEKRDENSNTRYDEGFNEYSYDKVFEKNYSIKRYDINNYQDISTFTMWNFYVFYEKN